MKKKISSSNIIYIIIGILFVYQLVLLGVLFTTHEKITSSVILSSLFFLIVGVLIDGIVFYVCRNIQQKLEMDEELKELYQYREQEMEMYKNIQCQMDELREKRHEFANQIQTAYIMVEQGVSREMLENYLADLENSYQMKPNKKEMNDYGT